MIPSSALYSIPLANKLYLSIYIISSIWTDIFILAVINLCFKENNKIEFNGNLISDYCENSLFIGCSSPECASDRHRYYCEMDISLFSIIMRTSSIDIIEDYLKENEVHVLPFKKCYDDILCYYDFKTVNNLGIIYDESKNTNFLERVPKDFVL